MEKSKHEYSLEDWSKYCALFVVGIMQEFAMSTEFSMATPELEEVRDTIIKDIKYANSMKKALKKFKRCIKQ